MKDQHALLFREPLLAGVQRPAGTGGCTCLLRTTTERRLQVHVQRVRASDIPLNPSRGNRTLLRLALVGISVGASFPSCRPGIPRLLPPIAGVPMPG